MRILYHPKKVTWLGFEAFVAPEDFDRTAQPVDIYDVFCRYYTNHKDAKYIYSFTSAINTLTLGAVSGVSYRWGETIAGVNYTYDITSGTAFTAGSTNRYVIVNNTSTSFNVLFVNGALWIYLGDFTINRIGYGKGDTKSPYLTYIHCHNIDNIKGFLAYSFWGTNLTGKLTFPNINLAFDGDRCFSQCIKLAGAVTITKNMKSIGSHCFNGTPITELEFTDGTDLEVIGHAAFIGCNLMSAPDFTKATKLYDIRYNAFNGCTGMTGTIVFPDSLTTIGYGAFHGTQFSGVLNIGKNITSIGYSAFTYNLFTSITVDALNTKFISDNTGGDTDVLYDIGTSGEVMANHSARGNSGTLIFRNDTTQILQNCSASNTLKTGTLTIPSTTTIIKDGAFSSCTGFTGNLTISNSVLSVGSNSFSYMTMTGNLILGSSLQSIGGECFRNGKWTGNLVIPNSLITIGGLAFWSVPFGGTIDIGDNLETIGMGAFGGCLFTGDLVIPASLITFDENQSYKNFNAVNFSTITSDSTIYPAYDNVLYSLKTSGKVIAMINAKSYIGILTLRSDTTEIYNGVFSGSPRTGPIVIPYTVTAIGEEAFRNCSGFNNTVTIGDTTSGSSLTTIGTRAFIESPNITGWNIYRTPAPTCNNSFSAYAKPLHVKSGATGYDVTPATAAAPWTNTAIFSSVTYDL